MPSSECNAKDRAHDGGMWNKPTLGYEFHNSSKRHTLRAYKRAVRGPLPSEPLDWTLDINEPLPSKVSHEEPAVSEFIPTSERQAKLKALFDLSDAAIADGMKTLSSDETNAIIAEARGSGT